MGHIIMSGIVPQLTKPIAGTPISEFAVGSTVKLNVDGQVTDFIIIHQGKPSNLYDDSCNGTWLLMKDIYNTGYWSSSNVNDYENSTIHIYLNSTFLGRLDANIQSAIKQVKIPYVNGTGNSAVASGSNGLSAQIFLLSCYEVGFTQGMNSYFPIDGAKLNYFLIANNSTANSKRIAYLNGEATNWWLRSPYTGNTSGAWIVFSYGDYGGGFDCTNSFGVRPALVMPSTALVNKTGMVVA